MDVYVETARDVLKKIIRGQLLYQTQIVELQEDIRAKLDRADRLVICGMSPVGRIAKQNLTVEGKPIEVLDLRDKTSLEEMMHTLRINIHGRETVYVICSS